MEHLLLRELCYRNLEAYKKALVMGNSFLGGLARKPGREIICRGLMYGRRLWDRCLSIWGPRLENWGGGQSTGNIEN